MFKTKDEFMAWLKKTANPSLQQMLTNFDDTQINELHGIYEKHGDMHGDYSMLTLSRKLGESVSHFMRLANNVFLKEESIDDKKAFVIKNVIALYSLINGGKTGSANYITGNKEAMYLGEGNMEEKFVRPLAKQAFEKSYQILKKLNLV